MQHNWLPYGFLYAATAVDNHRELPETKDSQCDKMCHDLNFQSMHKNRSRATEKTQCCISGRKINIETHIWVGYVWTSSKLSW